MFLLSFFYKYLIVTLWFFHISMCVIAAYTNLPHRYKQSCLLYIATFPNTTLCILTGVDSVVFNVPSKRYVIIWMPTVLPSVLATLRIHSADSITVSLYKTEGKRIETKKIIVSKKYLENRTPTSKMRNHAIFYIIIHRLPAMQMLTGIYH